MIKRTTMTATVLTLLACSSWLNAAEFTVKMLTSGANGQIMVMEPAYLKIAPGDTVNFVPADPSHNAQSVSIPAGASSFATPMGKEGKVTFGKEGVYVYKCLPHVTLGMVGVIQVGKAVNLEQTKQFLTGFKSTIAMNKDRVDQYIAQVK